MSLSKVLYWTGEERGVWGPGQLALHDGGYLVFGGDAVDKGAGDIRVVKSLLALKRRYPSQAPILSLFAHTHVCIFTYIRYIIQTCISFI